jgi:hypothetical protein
MMTRDRLRYSGERPVFRVGFPWLWLPRLFAGRDSCWQAVCGAPQV